MMLQGNERDAILEVEIRCLFLSAPIGFKCSNHIIQRVHIIILFSQGLD
jgi:predicted methyltransferase MtxX (methanogen marker protein 4)